MIEVVTDECWHCLCYPHVMPGGMTEPLRLNQCDPEADSRTAGVQILNGFVEHNMHIYTVSTAYVSIQYI